MTTTSPTVTLSEVRTFIAASATSSDLELLYDTMNARHKILREQAKAERAAVLQPGMTVTLEGLAPKYVNGLTGTIKEVKGAKATVTLDADSTRFLRWKGARRFYIAPDAQTYDMTGTPIDCCAPTP